MAESSYRPDLWYAPQDDFNDHKDAREKHGGQGFAYVSIENHTFTVVPFPATTIRFDPVQLKQAFQSGNVTNDDIRDAVSSATNYALDDNNLTDAAMQLRDGGELWCFRSCDKDRPVFGNETEFLRHVSADTKPIGYCTRLDKKPAGYIVESSANFAVDYRDADIVATLAGPYKDGMYLTWTPVIADDLQDRLTTLPQYQLITTDRMNFSEAALQPFAEISPRSQMGLRRVRAVSTIITRQTRGVTLR